MQMDILALALACDLTRVASIQFSTATSQVTHKWLGSNQTTCHHDYSHEGPTSLYALAFALHDVRQHGPVHDDARHLQRRESTLYNNDQSPQPRAAGDRPLVRDAGRLPRAEAERPHGLGGSGTLLDQSVICWGNELDMGAAHNHDDTPFVLVGGANGQLKTGQLVTFPLDFPDGEPNIAAQDRSRAQRPAADAGAGDGDADEHLRRVELLHRPDRPDPQLLTRYGGSIGGASTLAGGGADTSDSRNATSAACSSPLR